MNVGDRIPNELGYDESGKLWEASMLLGKRWVLYFYPKDNTSACTKQACSLRDGMADLSDLGITVLGVSKDTASSHRRFKEKYQLPFPLIADPDRKLHEAMGVLYPKKMYGKDVIGTLRTTFLISPEGRIEAVISGKEVSTEAHAQQIIDIVKKI